MIFPLTERQEQSVVSALLRALGQLESERHIKFFVCIMFSLQGLYG